MNFAESSSEPVANVNEDIATNTDIINETRSMFQNATMSDIEKFKKHTKSGTL